MANLFVEKSSGVARVTLDKPPVNVMDIGLMRELKAVLDEIRADGTAQVIVIAARGKLFSAGVDVKDHTADRVGEMLREFHSLVRALWSLEPPTVAAVQGSALGGGCELALASILSSRARRRNSGSRRFGSARSRRSRRCCCRA